MTRSFFSHPWILVTSIILHANLLHLIYNLFSLLIFGNVLEVNSGSKLTLLVIIFSGVVGNIGFVLFSDSSAIGFSGAVFGLIGACTVLVPNIKIPLPIGAVAVPVMIKFAGPIIAIGELLLSFFAFSNIAHFAHFSGFLVGIILALLFKLPIN